jgi:hypothetical protein
MKKFMLAALAALSLGVGTAYAAPSSQSNLPHKPNYYNWLAGGD